MVYDRIHGHHDPTLVILSILIAVFASYTALDLAGRIKTADGTARRIWLAASAVTLGGGIWSMHFVAMLAFNLDRPIAYAVSTTTASLVAAILVTGVGLHLVARRPAHGLNLVAAGCFTGIGIATMHYTGMAAMQMDANVTYEPWLFSLSVVIAIVASIVALWLSFNLRHAWEKLVAGFVMGAAIAGMHFTGMAAAIYTPLPETRIVDTTATIPLLAALIAVITFGVLLLGLLSATADRRFVAQAEREAASKRRSEDHFRSILDTAQDAFIAIDADDRITFWNRQAEATFGWTRESVMGKPLADTIVPERLRDAHRRGMERFLRTGEGPVLNQRLELSAVHADGREFPIEITITAVRTGESFSANAFVRDVSRRQQSQRELVAAKEQAEAASRAKSLFLANMSHELRTPLNAIIGFSEIIKDAVLGPIGNTTYRDYSADIYRSGRHLLGLINDILDVSRAETGNLTLRESSVSMNGVVDQAVATVQEPAQHGGVELKVQVSSGLPLIHADPQRLRQIIVNLMSNAVKFTPTGGNVSLAVGIGHDGGLAITVTDTGIGMSPEQVQIALKPFGQVDDTLARRHEGAGLGLPLTRHFLDLHQGTIEIDSVPNIGTRIIARLPAARTLNRIAPAAD